MLNRVILIGRLTADPETKFTQSGTQTTIFSLAVDRAFSKGDKKEVDFINCVSWGKLAKICADYLEKGKLVAIEGRLQVDRYEDKDGNKKTAYKVVCDTMKMLEKRKSEAGNEQPPSDEDMPF